MCKTKYPMLRHANVLAVCALTSLGALTPTAQELIYREDFETDGEATNPQRYTTVGRDVYEVDRIRSELNNPDQLGPIYWAPNFQVSYTGVPAPTAARRMVMAWDLAITDAEASPALLDLFDSSIKWLLNNKAKAKIVVAGAGVDALGVLGARLTAAGHELVADDTTVVEEQITTQGDMLFHAGGGSRGAKAGFPMLVINSSDADDVLTSSIGTATALEAGKGKIVATGHPATGGKTGEFDIAAGSFTYQLLGDQLPANPVIVASFTAVGEDPPIVRPLIMLMNSTNDTPAGTVFGGGPFTGQSGQRFFGGAGMNKWTVPEQGDRSLTLQPINVRGKTNLKLTIAAAGTFLDFEVSSGTRGAADYLEVLVDTDGTAGPNDFERLIFFTPPASDKKYVDDATTRPERPTRLGLEFKDVTYDIPAGATELIVEVRSLSTWWNEIFAFDNIRITSGTIVTPPPAVAMTSVGGVLKVAYTDVLVSSPSVNGPWTPVPGATSPYTVNTAVGSGLYYRSTRP